MPVKKALKGRAKIIIRDLGDEGKKAIDRKALGKVRGGAIAARKAALKRVAAGDEGPGCTHDGHTCAILHCSPAAKDELTVYV